MSSNSQPPILKYSAKKVVRILRPNEYLALRAQGDSIRLDGALYSGMRYVELRRFQEHPEWFDGRLRINLPPTAVLKGKRRQLQRTINLSKQGGPAIALFLKSKRLPTDEAWTDILKKHAVKAGLDPIGLGPKTTRKTWESWLFSCFSGYDARIFLSQGHDGKTSLQHYLGLGFYPEDIDAMRPFVEGIF